ncbi:MAG: hypothetical protein JWP06_1222 [Candidatus Saccharibacteria bacterium]|jgi:hypothetical protein|nr:hypothetical protein [Candidatus Saccharibacteria bacterium]
MKLNLINSIKPILADRLMAILMILLILICLAYCIYVGVSLRPSDLQVAVHYSAYGETSFYRDKWYYLITFIVFGIMLAVMHTALVAKIYLQGHRQLALLFAWLSLLLIVIAWFMTWAVLKVAFL